MRARQVLHCNLNVVDIDAATSFYEDRFGLTVRMRSETTDGDSKPLGIDGPTHSMVHFLYDHRGGHVSPAVELVEWRTPATDGLAYEDATAIGMQSLLFAMSSPTPGPMIDPDGVRIEMIDDDVPAPTFAGVRLSCVDLRESVRWYEALGWRPVGDLSVDQGSKVQRLALPTHPFELHLTEWTGSRERPPAQDVGNMRGLFRMALAVDDVRAAYEESQRQTVVEMGEPIHVPLPGTPLGGLWVSFFRDPNGVTVELVERPLVERD